ncbi:hypothetical protein FA13DRAFT_1807378 [Coprinellus micaceus]|uniref:Uncharacterized protein n=1 Tax=Coprinellus micaceus TaxID=71717 RepID=A0A4Y7R851_COPMI|nr:hypothetical protein FA13DRAFT_1807378 [Coprinellus micaceus]
MPSSFSSSLLHSALSLRLFDCFILWNSLCVPALKMIFICSFLLCRPPSPLWQLKPQGIASADAANVTQDPLALSSVTYPLLRPAHHQIIFSTHPQCPPREEAQPRPACKSFPFGGDIESLDGPACKELASSPRGPHDRSDFSQAGDDYPAALAPPSASPPTLTIPTPWCSPKASEDNTLDIRLARLAPNGGEEGWEVFRFVGSLHQSGSEGGS